ncbi:hypothetical protein [Jeotgalicoccus halotolerans]|uniref:Uncharacterized protein n=1 Tax=Jeotgalicoccus halotolerans TaxID=157227 RepID=A0A3E0AVL8_9STAP|nr:hypothetical protein [Jeotgalicoccus halotolerans]REG23805.1 hypothetical protein DFR63_1552 [Jeotgalicoccus halotolerans]
MTGLAKLIVAGGRGQTEPPELCKGKNGRGKFLTRHDGRRVGKVCSGCHDLKHYDDFGKHSKNMDGKRNICKICRNTQRRIKRQSKEYREKQREYNSRPEVKERKQEIRREHKKKNREQYALYDVRRRARKRALPDSLTLTQSAGIVSRFPYCPITGSDDLHTEHFIAIATGHGGGHTIQNVWRLDAYINNCKSDYNPFEFFRREDIINEIITDYGRTREQIEAGFLQVVEYLANQNEMTVQQFEEYTNYCYNNRKTDEEIEQLNAAGETVNSRKEFEAYTAAMSETIMQGVS